MTHWEERIDGATDPALVDDHVARYAFAAPLVRTSATWVDLGCGNAVAAARAIDQRPERTVLVDVSAEAVAAAARELGGGAETHVRDLADAEDLAWLSELLAGAASPICVTAFEVVEHLEHFDGLLRCLVQASENGADVVLSVPNDAFWGTQNPYHRTIWSAPAIDELRSMLPPETRFGAQYELSGSWVTPDGDAQPGPAAVAGRGSGAVPSQFVLSFGPRVADAEPVAAVRVADWAARRRWERQREADLAYFADEIEVLRRRLREATTTPPSQEPMA
ncbi:MAG TPA: methyltransferase domain-containing protein [Baekduia sp.]|nr:methyltransferase domain-containing protein [Baekduia sp.]